MEAIVTALADQHAELDALLIGLDDSQWARPSPCEGWDVADVLLHLAQTDELALASARGEFAAGLDRLAGRIDPAIERPVTRRPVADVDDGADVMVIAERGRPGAEVYARWRAGATELVTVLAAADPHQRVTWVAGELSTRTLATTRLAETWIHTGDIAAGLGVPVEPTDRLRHVARLAWRTVPYAFARAGRELAGPVRFELQSPSGETWDFTPDAEPLTVVEGDAVDLCFVAARRVDPATTSLRATGPDAQGVLELVRTYA